MVAATMKEVHQAAVVPPPPVICLHFLAQCRDCPAKPVELVLPAAVAAEVAMKPAVQVQTVAVVAANHSFGTVSPLTIDHQSRFFAHTLPEAVRMSKAIRTSFSW